MADILPFLLHKHSPHKTFSLVSNPQKAGLLRFLALPCLPAPFISFEQLPQTKIPVFRPFQNPTGRTVPHSFSHWVSLMLTPSFTNLSCSFFSSGSVNSSNIFKYSSLTLISHSSRASSSK